jgi:transposase-like protein
MVYQNEYLKRNLYTLELQHRICKEHIEDSVKLADLVRKYNLTTHSLIHDWLRKLGYLPGKNRRSQVLYIGLENFGSVNKKPDKTKPELSEIAALKKELEDAKLLAEGYRRMIEIAEQELKIPIKKKLNTK